MGIASKYKSRQTQFSWSGVCSLIRPILPSIQHLDHFGYTRP